MFLVEVEERKEKESFDFTFRDIRVTAEVTHLCCTNGGKAEWNIQRRKWTGSNPEEWVFSCPECEEKIKLTEELSEKKQKIDQVAFQGGEIIIDEDIKVRQKA